MRFKSLLYLLVFVLSVSSCDKDDNRCKIEINNQSATVTLEQYSDSLYALNLWLNDSLRSTWSLKYPVYKFDCGDVTGDGIPEIAVGVIKSTRFDPKPDKRLFLYKVTTDYYIRPLWLGSRVAQPLIDFRVISNFKPALIRTLEKEEDGSYLVAEYKWRGFGLQFTKYIKRGISLKEAEVLL